MQFMAERKEMKLAVISDIHGNYKALEAFEAYIEEQKPDGIILLGDYLTDGPYPQRTLKMIYDLMQKYTCYMVRGNREEYLIQNFHEPQGWKPSSANGALYYTALNVTPKDIAFFESLPISRQVQIENFPLLTICHGTPDDSRGNFLIDEGVREKCMRTLETEYMLGGHSHNQEIDIRYGKTYVNPGSLGLAVDGIGKRAPFAMLYGEEQNGKKTWRPELINIPYDVDGYLADFGKCGLDEYGKVLNRAVKKTLLTGINYFYLSVVEAWKISGKNSSETPEEIWNRVAEILEV